MRVLMLSGDPWVLDPNTETGKRMAEYRQVLGEPASPAGGLDVLLAYGNVWSLAVAFFAGLKMLRRKKYDVVTAQSPEHYLLAWVFSKISGVPWQMQIHTDIFSPYFVKNPTSPAGGSVLNKVRVWLAKLLFKRASCIRVVSERIKNSILRTSQVPKDLRCPIIVLPIFVDTEKIKNMPIKTDLHQKYGKDKFIILMASRLTKEKNIGLAIEIFAEITRRISPPLTPPPYEGGGVGEGVNSSSRAKNPLLLIVGDGPELKNLKILNTKYQLLNNVIFEPHTTDLVSYYKTCDLFLLTSNYEGYGRTLVEAATAGAKTISSDVGIAQEILEPDAIFKVGDIEGLKNKITAALRGNLPPPKLVASQTKDEYLKLYKRSFEACLS